MPKPTVGTKQRRQHAARATTARRDAALAAWNTVRPPEETGPIEEPTGGRDRILATRMGDDAIGAAWRDATSLDGRDVLEGAAARKLTAAIRSLGKVLVDAIIADHAAFCDKEHGDDGYGIHGFHDPLHELMNDLKWASCMATPARAAAMWDAIADRIAHSAQSKQGPETGSEGPERSPDDWLTIVGAKLATNDPDADDARFFARVDTAIRDARDDDDADAWLAVTARPTAVRPMEPAIADRVVRHPSRITPDMVAEAVVRATSLPPDAGRLAAIVAADETHGMRALARIGADAAGARA